MSRLLFSLKSPTNTLLAPPGAPIQENVTLSNLEKQEVVEQSQTQQPRLCFFFFQSRNSSGGGEDVMEITTAARTQIGVALVECFTAGGRLTVSGQEYLTRRRPQGGGGVELEGKQERDADLLRGELGFHFLV